MIHGQQNINISRDAFYASVGLLKVKLVYTR
jgi:hypothetical protein